MGGHGNSGGKPSYRFHRSKEAGYDPCHLIRLPHIDHPSVQEGAHLHPAPESAQQQGKPQPDVGLVAGTDQGDLVAVHVGQAGGGHSTVPP